MKSIKTKDVEKLLKANGWTVGRTNGKHTIWRDAANTLSFPIPRHREVSPAVLRNLSKLIELPPNWK